MAPDQLLVELERVARGAGLEIRAVGMRRKGAGPGGLCTIGGRAVVLLNLLSSAIERCTVLADALVGRDLGAQQMPGEVRYFISDRARSRSRLLLPRRRPGPGITHCKGSPPRRNSGKV